MIDNLRNIAIIAHVDHGKTTLVDCLLQQSGTLDRRSAGEERIMDSNEQEMAPLVVHVPVLHIPFYELHRRAAELPSGQTYMLYCGKGVMSRLHASHLVESTELDVKVYAP